MKAVKVTWIDASHNIGCSLHDVILKSDIVHTYGELVHKCGACVILRTHNGGGEDNDDHFRIPRGCIKKIEVLK